MRLTVLIVALTVLIGRLAAASDDVAGGSQKIGPSFDCGKAVKPIAKMICASDSLSRMDMEFVQAYQALRHQVGEPRQQQLREEALEFHHRMLRECGVPDDGPTSGSSSCVRAAYAEQRLRWLSQLVGPASEEAKRNIKKHVLLHHDLQRLGFMKANADGVYGPDTRLGLTEFQRVYGLPVTGFLSDADSQVIENRISVTSSVSEQALVRPGAQINILPLPDPASSTQSSQVVSEPQREKELPRLPSAQPITGREPTSEFSMTRQAVTPPTIPSGRATSSSDQAAEAVRKLGLLGTFSANCAAFSASQSWGSVWEVDAKGNVTITIVASDSAAKFVMTKAEILPNDQLLFHRERVERSDRNEITIQRIGDGYRVIRNVNLINGVVLVDNGLSTQDRKPAGVMKLCGPTLTQKGPLGVSCLDLQRSFGSKKGPKDAALYDEIMANFPYLAPLSPEQVNALISFSDGCAYNDIPNVPGRTEFLQNTIKKYLTLVRDIKAFEKTQIPTCVTIDSGRFLPDEKASMETLSLDYFMKLAEVARRCDSWRKSEVAALAVTRRSQELRRQTGLPDAIDLLASAQRNLAAAETEYRNKRFLFFGSVSKITKTIDSKEYVYIVRPFDHVKTESAGEIQCHVRANDRDTLTKWSKAEEGKTLDGMGVVLEVETKPAIGIFGSPTTLVVLRARCSPST